MLKEKLIVAIGVFAWCVAFLTGMAFLASLVSMFLGAADAFFVLGALTAFTLSLLPAAAIEWAARGISSNDQPPETGAAEPQASASEPSSEATDKSMMFRVTLDVILALVFTAGAFDGVYTIVEDPSRAIPGRVLGVMIWICLLCWTIRDLFALLRRRRECENARSDASGIEESAR